MPLDGAQEMPEMDLPLLLSGGSRDIGLLVFLNGILYQLFSGLTSAGRAGQPGIEWEWGSSLDLCWAISFLSLQPERSGFC